MGVAIAIVAVALGLLGYQLFGGRQTVDAPNRKTAFYTDDDGKSFFTDAANKMVPFTHNGKQAYRADVFEGFDGKKFVGLIYRHTDSGKNEIESYFSTNPKYPDGLARRTMERGRMQVTPAGANDKAWQLNDDVTMERLQASVTDASGKPARLVTP
jgi:hypothetical protein